MNSLYFNNDLVPLILNRKKTITWRITEPSPKRKSDTEKIAVGEIVSIMDRDEKCICNTRIDNITKKSYGELSVEEKLEHGNYESDEKLMNKFSQFYGNSKSRNDNLQ